MYADCAHAGALLCLSPLPVSQLRLRSAAAVVSMRVYSHLAAILAAVLLLGFVSAHVPRRRNLLQELEPQTVVNSSVSSATASGSRSRRCGTPDTSPDDVGRFLQAVSAHRAAKAAAQTAQAAQDKRIVTVPVVVTVVEPEGVVKKRCVNLGLYR